MNHFGLTSEEKKTHLQQYNHALFKNSLAFMDVIWEINLLYGTAVILEDKSDPGLGNTEFSYEELYQEFFANRIPAEDQAIFHAYMAPENLEKLREEVNFYLHLRAADGSFPRHRIVLTPAVDERGILYCVYLGGLCLHSAAAPDLQSDQARFWDALLSNCYFHFEFDVTAGSLIWGDFVASDGTHPILDATGLIDPCPYDIWVQKWYELYQPQFDKEQEANIFNGEYFKRAFARNERFLDVEVKQKRPKDGNSEYMHIFVVLMENAADSHLHACVIWREIDPFRSRAIERRLAMRTDNEVLKRTVGRDEQFRRAALSGALMVYNINLSKNQIEDEFYEIVDGKSYPMLQLVGLTAPCSFDTFCERWNEAKVPNDSKETFKKLYNRQYLLDAYNRGEFQLEIEFDTIIGRGIPITLRSTILLVKDPESGELLAMVNGKDVTEQRREEREKRKALQAAYDAANRANTAKSNFLARMSHDIRTPMNAIMGMATIASAHLDDSQRVSDCLQKITLASQNLLDLISEVLDMSEIESGKIDLQDENFNLSDLVDDLLRGCRPLAQSKEQTLSVSVHGIDNENVIGDRQRLLQALMNLAGNAVKFTPPGGSIRLTIAKKATNRPRIGCYEFTFEDNGIGIGPEFMDHLFEPFERAADPRVQKERGTGLGLAISRNIIQMMNGKIEVESTLNQGSKFTVTVFLRLQDDVANADPAQLSGLERLSQADFSGHRALMAEDNALNAEIALEFFDMAGLQVDWVENGKLALDTISQAEDGYYDIIFMDIQMPVMNGHEAVRAIRRLGRKYTDEIPILAMSANAFAEDVEESKASGMNDHIAKPLDLDRLLKALNQWLH